MKPTDNYTLTIRDTAVNAISIIGDQLIKAKDLLPQDMWESWLQHQFNMSIDTAENYMNISRQRQKDPSLKHLPTEILLSLLISDHDTPKPPNPWRVH